MPIHGMGRDFLRGDLMGSGIRCDWQRAAGRGFLSAATSRSVTRRFLARTMETVWKMLTANAIFSLSGTGDD